LKEKVFSGLEIFSFSWRSEDFSLPGDSRSKLERWQSWVKTQYQTINLNCFSIVKCFRMFMNILDISLFSKTLSLSNIFLPIKLMIEIHLMLRNNRDLQILCYQNTNWYFEIIVLNCLPVCANIGIGCINAYMKFYNLTTFLLELGEAAFFWVLIILSSLFKLKNDSLNL